MRQKSGPEKQPAEDAIVATKRGSQSTIWERSESLQRRNRLEG